MAEENNIEDDDRGPNGEDNTGGGSRPLNRTKPKREDYSQDGTPAAGLKPTYHSNTQAERATQGGRKGRPTGRAIQKKKRTPDPTRLKREE